MAENKDIIEMALRYFISRYKADIAQMKSLGMDVGFLPKYLAEAEKALKEIQGT